jgi:hypothetical protein
MIRASTVVAVLGMCVAVSGATITYDACEQYADGSPLSADNSRVGARVVIDNRAGTEDVTGLYYSWAGMAAGHAYGARGYNAPDTDGNPWAGSTPYTDLIFGCYYMIGSDGMGYAPSVINLGLSSPTGEPCWAPYWIPFDPNPNLFQVPEQWFSGTDEQFLAALDAQQTPGQWLYGAAHPIIGAVPAGLIYDVPTTIEGVNIHLFHSPARMDWVTDGAAGTEYDYDPRPQTVPEPATMTLLTAGLVALVRRRKM